VTLKVVFCWSDISGYMTACWRALCQLPEIELCVIAFQAHTETAFSAQLMQGIPSHLLNLEERDNFELIEHLVQAEQPHVVVLSGWFHKPYRQLAFSPLLRDCRFIMGMDTPWCGTWKQHFAPLVLRPYLKRMIRTVVTGERSWQYARHLGIPKAKIVRGLYGIDYEAWESLWEERYQSSWPRSFLFVGRYIHTKAIDILVEAYQQYRLQVPDPWVLVCCGQGSLEHLLQGQPGIHNRGFVQPEDMKTVWREAGAFLLPSRFDPWPLALVEASAAGLPVICTDACGSAVEVVRPDYNGLLVPEGDSEALAQALLTLHKRYDVLSAWGKRAQQLAAPYASEVWADRWQKIITNL
jgi:glycosyltransferase involved in cell wall biosynthesis